MKESLLDQLVCPETQEPLDLHVSDSQDGDVRTGELCCDDEHRFLIDGGIPRFVEPEALEDQTSKSFSQKWAKHDYYRLHTEAFYKEWYLTRYGFGEMEGLRQFLSGKKTILDAGTGSGRDAVTFAELSSADVFAVDLASEALSIASNDISHPRVAFVNSDLNALPFKDEFFDFISCDQVIHHTSNPQATFEKLKKKLKRGGHICCYVYKRKSAIREFVDDYVRKHICNMPIDEALALCEGITSLGRSLAKLNVKVDVEQDIPLLGIRKGEVDIQRLFHWNIMKCFWNDDFDFFTNNIINYDWYHPENCYRFDPKEFRSWFDEGWDIEHWDEREAGTSCRARKI